MSDFWTRRRAAVAAAEAAEAEAQEARAKAEAAAEEARALDEMTDAEVLAHFGLPDPDSLAPGEGIAGFMRAGVPEHLRRRALRQLWRLNPALANLDMLLEYGEDYTDAATVVANLSTTYQVGKGMGAHVKAMEEKARAAAEALEKSAKDAAESEGDAGEGAAAMPAETLTAEPGAAPAGPDLRLPEAPLRSPAVEEAEDDLLPDPPTQDLAAAEARETEARAADDARAAALPAPAPSSAPGPAPARAPRPRPRMRFAYPEA